MPISTKAKHAAIAATYATVITAVGGVYATHKEHQSKDLQTIYSHQEKMKEIEISRIKEEEALLEKRCPIKGEVDKLCEKLKSEIVESLSRSRMRDPND